MYLKTSIRDKFLKYFLVIPRLCRLSRLWRVCWLLTNITLVTCGEDVLFQKNFLPKQPSQEKSSLSIQVDSKEKYLLLLMLSNDILQIIRLKEALNRVSSECSINKPAHVSIKFWNLSVLHRFKQLKTLRVLQISTNRFVYLHVHACMYACVNKYSLNAFDSPPTNHLLNDLRLKLKNP